MIRTGCKNKFKTDLGYNEIYNHYVSNSEMPINKSKHSEVLTSIFENIMNTAIKEGKTIKFPLKFGNFNVQKKKQKIVYNKDGSINRICFKTDFGATNQYWKSLYPDKTYEEILKIPNKTKVYCKNKYRMKFKYDKSEAHYKGKSVIMFIPSRNWCREMSKHLKTNPYATDYKEY